MTTTENPLLNHFRKKTLYVALPSAGKYYPSGITLSADGELGIMPMTNQDEIRLKSPDALYNAEAVLDLFRSTVPDIVNPMEMPACDRDVILLAIQHATRGEEFTISSQCTNPECKETEEYTANLSVILASAQPIPNDDVVVLKDGENTVTVKVRPYTYDAQIKTNMLDFQYARMELINNAEATNEEKARMFTDAIAQAAALTVSVVADAVVEVDVSTENEGFVVSEPDQIFEWVENIQSDWHRKITDKIDSLCDPQIDPIMTVKCSACDHEYKTRIDLDPQRLF